MKRTASWLEQDDERAWRLRDLWRKRAQRGQAEMRARQALDAIDLCFAEDVRQTLAWNRAHAASKAYDADVERLGELRRQSREDAEGRPWLKAKPIYPTRATTPYNAAVALVASLQYDPPSTGGGR